MMGRVFGGMAASLDGFIAAKDGDLSWLNAAMAPDEEYGFAATLERTGAYIIGANTYREILAAGMSLGEAIPIYVITHQKDLKKLTEMTYFYCGDFKALLTYIQAETAKDICVYGGADILTQFINLDLVDEIGISIIPVLLGEGVAFFGKINAWKKLKLAECIHYPSGIVLLYYGFSRT